MVVVVVVVVVVSGVNVVVVEFSVSGGAAKYRTGLFVVKQAPVIGQRNRPVSPFAQANNLFDLFGFAATVPSSKQRPAVASDKYRVALLMHICGARLEAAHRIENSILGRHPPVPGSLNSDVLIPTQIETIGFLICEGDEDLPEAIDSATGVDASVLAAALVP